LSYFSKRSIVTLAELKSHLIASKRLSEPYFVITGNLDVFLSSNPKAQELFALTKNEENPLDPLVVPRRSLKVVDVKATEGAPTPSIAAPAEGAPPSNAGDAKPSDSSPTASA